MLKENLESTIKIKDSEALVTKLKLQLSYDNLGIVKFFKLLINSYLNRDPRILEIIEENNKHRYDCGRANQYTLYKRKNK